MDNLASSAQLIFYAAASVAALIFSISHLFRTMTTSYGKIIDRLEKQNTELKNQNVDQQCQIDATKATVGEVKAKVSEVVKKINGN